MKRQSRDIVELEHYKNLMGKNLTFHQTLIAQEEFKKSTSLLNHYRNISDFHKAGNYGSQYREVYSVSKPKEPPVTTNYLTKATQTLLTVNQVFKASKGLAMGVFSLAGLA